MTSEHPALRSIPDHVPENRVKRFDFMTDLGDRPQEVIAGLHDGPSPFYSPVRHMPFGNAPGAWVVSREADVRDVMSKPEIFSSVPQQDFLRAIGESFNLSPLSLDPPEHGKFRSMINPLFSPQRILALEPKIRGWCVELIGRFAHRGKCDFLTEFSNVFPTGVFIDLLGLPKDRLADFRGWTQNFIHGKTKEDRIDAIHTILDYFRGLFVERRATPTDDMVSFLMAQKVDERPISDGELTGLVFLLFAAGLDTIVNSLAFIFRHLAEHPELQDHLRANPVEIPRHAEEMMRLFAPVTSQRLATQDTELAGLKIKKGDYLALSLAAASRDPRKFPNPGTLDATRNPNPHLAFGMGIHRCVGAQLARRDLTIAIEEWLARIPRFSLDPDIPVTAIGGAVLSLTSLNFVWDADGAAAGPAARRE